MVSIPIPLLMKKEGCSSFYAENGVLYMITLLSLCDSRMASVKRRAVGDFEIRVAYASSSKWLKKPQRCELESLGISDRPMRLRTFFVEWSGDFVMDRDLQLSDVFGLGDVVSATGVTIGKGFAGAMKRHGFGGLCASHGVSLTHRSHGATGQCQDPGKRFKGRRMAGRMGNIGCTVKGLKVVYFNPEEGVVGVCGSVPGAKGGKLFVRRGG